MAVTIIPRYKMPTTGLEVTQSLMRHFDWRVNRCFPNVGLFPWESDLLVVTKSGYVTEVEVKISVSDWKADLTKSKWKPRMHQGYIKDPDRPAHYKMMEAPVDLNVEHGWKYVKAFYYAVPPELLNKVPVGLPEWAGILEVKGESVKIRRPAVTRKASPLTEQMMSSLYNSMYFRFNDKFLSRSRG